MSLDGNDKTNKQQLYENKAIEELEIIHNHTII